MAPEKPKTEPTEEGVAEWQKRFDELPLEFQRHLDEMAAEDRSFNEEAPEPLRLAK